MVVVPGEVVVAVPVIGLMVVGIVALGVDGAEGECRSYRA